MKARIFPLVFFLEIGHILTPLPMGCITPFYQDCSIREPKIRNRRFESGTQEIRKRIIWNLFLVLL